MTDSKQKGKRGEREVAEMFRAAGYDARRGVQYAGDPTAPDVLVEDIPYLHVEVKNRERHDFWGAMAQAQEDAGAIQVPVVFSRMKRKPWLVTMAIEDWFRFLRRYHIGGAGGAPIAPREDTHPLAHDDAD